MTESQEPKPRKMIGRAEKTSFPELGLEKVPARIDTGARTSSIWASEFEIDEKGRLNFCLFGKGSPYYTGEKIKTKRFSRMVVSSSMGSIQKRYVVKILIKIRGRKVRAAFTLADRSMQVYPILVGRNVLRGKFIVDVQKGRALTGLENEKVRKLQALLDEEN